MDAAICCRNVCAVLIVTLVSVCFLGLVLYEAPDETPPWLLLSALAKHARVACSWLGAPCSHDANRRGVRECAPVVLSVVVVLACMTVACAVLRCLVHDEDEPAVTRQGRRSPTHSVDNSASPLQRRGREASAQRWQDVVAASRSARRGSDTGPTSLWTRSHNVVATGRTGAMRQPLRSLSLPTEGTLASLQPRRTLRRNPRRMAMHLDASPAMLAVRQPRHSPLTHGSNGVSPTVHSAGGASGASAAASPACTICWNALGEQCTACETANNIDRRCAEIVGGCGTMHWCQRFPAT